MTSAVVLTVSILIATNLEDTEGDVLVLACEF